MASSLLQELIANRFAKLAGLNISGTIPLQQDLVNEALAELVQSWSAPKQGQSSDGSVTRMLELVRKLEVRAEQGVILVDFEIGV